MTDKNLCFVIFVKTNKIQNSMVEYLLTEHHCLVD